MRVKILMKIHHIRKNKLMIPAHLQMRSQGYQVDVERNQQEGDITQREENKKEDQKNLKVL